MQALIIQLITVLVPVVRQAILDFQNAHNGRFPTEEELNTQFNENVTKYLAEGTDWLSKNPKT